MAIKVDHLKYRLEIRLEQYWALPIQTNVQLSSPRAEKCKVGNFYNSNPLNFDLQMNFLTIHT